MKRSRTTMLLIAALIAAIGANILYVILFRIIAIRKDSIAASMVELAGEDARENVMSSMRSLVDDTAGDRETLATFFVSEDDVVDFIRMLEKAAASANVDLEILSANVERNDTDTLPPRLALTLKTAGAWSGTSAFLALIDVLPKRIELRQVFLEHGGTTLDAWQGSFTIHAYFGT